MKITDEMLYASASKARDLWLSSAFPNDIPEHQFSHRFNRTMKRLMKEQCRPPRLNHVIHMMRRTAAILLVVTAVSFSCLMTVDAYRERFIEIVTHVFHELTDYRFSTEIPGSQSETELGLISLGFIPNGMDKADEYGDETFYSVSYGTEDGMYFDLTCTLITENQDAHKIVDTENAVVREYSVNGMEATIISKDENNTILWTYGNILFHLYGNLPLDIEKQIAESVTVA